MLSPQLYCFPQHGVCVLFREPALGSLSSSNFPAVSLFVRETHFLFHSTPRMLCQNSAFVIKSQQRLSTSVTSSYTQRNCFFPSFPSTSRWLVYFCSLDIQPGEQVHSFFFLFLPIVLLLLFHLEAGQSGGCGCSGSRMNKRGILQRPCFSQGPGLTLLPLASSSFLGHQSEANTQQVLNTTVFSILSGAKTVS